jgi:hypothetical protein
MTPHPMKTSLRLLLSAGLALAFAGLTRAADLAGNWQSQFDSQIGVQKYLFTFKVDGEKLTGTATGERNGEKSTVEIQKGKVTKDSIYFAEPLHVQDQDIVVEYIGKMTGDDELKLTRKVGDFASYEITAKRVKTP